MVRILFVTVFFLLAGCDSRDQPNQAPQLAAIADQSAVSGEVIGPIPIEASDDGGLMQLRLAVIVDDPSLVDVSLESEGGFSITLSSIDELTGSSRVTVSVTDSEGLSASQSFRVEFTRPAISFDTLVREIFAEQPNTTPRQVNGVEIEDDAGSFDDLVDAG